jgi:hypothetical protein
MPARAADLACFALVCLAVALWVGGLVAMAARALAPLFR